MLTAELEAKRSLPRRLTGLAVSIALVCLGNAPVVSGQTVFSGSYSESGTRTDCNSNQTPTAWTQTGSITITLSPSFSALPSGGPVTGTFSYSGTDMGCSTQPAGGQGSVTGTVTGAGQVTLAFTKSVAGCSLTGQGTVDEVFASIPSACLDHPGSGSLDVTTRASSSGGSGAPGCISFPAGFVPFTSISYVTAANFAGDHLVVGVPAPGAFSTIGNIPLPAFANQQFCDSQVQLAPQQFYPGVYVPTADESGGNFGAFTGLSGRSGHESALPERDHSLEPVEQRIRLANRRGAGGVGEPELDRDRLDAGVSVGTGDGLAAEWKGADRGLRTAQRISTIPLRVHFLPPGHHVWSTTAIT